MEVEAQQVHPGGVDGGLDGGVEDVLVQRDAELGVLLAGDDVVVGVGPDAGGDPVEDLHLLSVPGADGLQQGQLLEAVDDDAAHAALHRQLQLGGQLVVAVELDALGGKAGGEGAGELPAGDHVHAQPGVLHQPQQGGGAEGLGGVGRPGVLPLVQELLVQGPEAALQCGLRVDVQRGAVGLGQGGGVAAVKVEGVVADLHAHGRFLPIFGQGAEAPEWFEQYYTSFAPRRNRKTTKNRPRC